MDVDLRPVKKLRESAAVRSALGPIIEAVCASPADLARLRVVCDWIQYKQNFREPVVGRPVGGTDLEIAVDLRRCADLDMEASVKHALADPGRAGPRALGARPGQLHLAVQRAVLAGPVRLGARDRAKSTSSRCRAARATPGTPRRPGS